jgi:hypothetical protein
MYSTPSNMDGLNPPTPAAPAPVPGFSRLQMRALEGLRRRYQQGGDRFDIRELAHLRFQHWLYQTGRLTA